MISIIAAIAENNAIGVNNDLPWRLPNDMKRFKELTTGHTIIMGRKTYDSLPKGALPNRKNIVISRDKNLSLDSCKVFNSLQEAVNEYKHETEIFIIGGASIYEQALRHADKLYITLVHYSPEKADTFFPEINKEKWVLSESKSLSNDGKHLYSYTFQTYVRKK